MSMNGSRLVHTADAIEWLQQSPVLEGCSLLASMPDIGEFPGYSLEQWKEWFSTTASLILSRTPPRGVTLFFQSDIKMDGEWVDKGFIVQKAAEALGHKLLWHKVVCRAPLGQPTFGRPGYSHILCFSQELTLDLAKSTADVMPETGEKTWVRGMGIDVCVALARFIKEQTPTKTLVHPFCGEGSMIATANAFGLDAIGIERSSKRAEKARQLQVRNNGQGWVLDL